MSFLRLWGHLLLWLGFLVGVFMTVRHVEVVNDKWSTIQWPYYVGSLLVGLAGVVVLRLTQQRAVTHADKLQSDIKVLEAKVSDLLAELAALLKGRDATSVFAVHTLIDARLVDKINAFVHARETLIHTYGLRQYAQVMTDFSIAERLVNRAWSASADGYIDEVWLSLEGAQSKFQVVEANLLALKKAQMVS